MSTTFQWFQRFKALTNRNDDLVAHVCYLMSNDRRLTIYEMAERVEISYCSYQAILTEDLGIRCVTAMLVP